MVLAVVLDGFCEVLIFGVEVLLSVVVAVLLSLMTAAWVLVLCVTVVLEGTGLVVVLLSVEPLVLAGRVLLLPGVSLLFCAGGSLVELLFVTSAEKEKNVLICEHVFI